MAVLRTRTARLIALLTLLVGLAHWAGLRWVVSQWAPASKLESFAPPMLTRTLAAHAPQPTPQALKTARRSAAPDHFTYVEPSTDQPRRERKPPPEPESPEALFEAPEVSTPAEPSLLANLPDLPPAPKENTWPLDARLSYEMRGFFRGPVVGSAEVLWQRVGNKYQVRVQIDMGLLFGSFVMTSQGVIRNNELYPMVYEETTRVSRRGIELGENLVKLNNGSEVPRPASTQDTASQFVELSHRFSQGLQTLAVGSVVPVVLARPDGVDPWFYDVDAEEALPHRADNSLGPIMAFHLKPRPLERPRGNVTAEMWFAPSLSYLPVRILVKMGQEAQVDLLIRRIEQALPKPLM